MYQKWMGWYKRVAAREDVVQVAQKDEAGGEDSDEDVVTDYLLPCDDDMSVSGGTPAHLVPTISVTTHSPGGKHYPVLEENLHQLHEIHESIRAMREASAQVALGLSECSRLSASCPSLNEAGDDSSHSSPTHTAPLADILAGKKEWLMCRRSGGTTPRRRSWTALEDLSGGGDKQAQHRQRSMSLSSMESDGEEAYLDRVDSGLLEPAQRRSGRAAGAASTHSLNEADLQSDFSKVLARHEARQRLLAATRLPLQKSVSTPSIVAVRDMAVDVANGVTAALAPAPQRPSGTESDTEEDALAAAAIPHQMSLDEFLTTTDYDPSEKRRKRGSIFFRKKKDKSKKASHQWVSACYGSAHACDWCSKPLTNKPALYCENCTTTVHQNSCKDHILDCNKPKIIKNVSKTSGLQTLPSKSGVKRGSLAGAGHNHNTSGNSQIINEEKEGDGSHHDGTNFSDDVPLVQFEFLDESPVTAYDLEADPTLGLHEEESDSWSPTVGKEVTKKLKEKEVKRQEHIYEFILTEKHHCLTLLVMQKVFVDGLARHFSLGKDVERMFPRLPDLTALHLEFLRRLRLRQRASPVVDTISDILLDLFSAVSAAKLKTFYGEFCSRHRDAVDIYKNYLTDRRFSEFVRHCQTNPLLKKKGIPECILFVTQRLTKYPLLIEPLIKAAKENKPEMERLTRCLALVKEILVEVDAQVAEKEKEDRKLEIYNKIEAKSFTVHMGNKFKKSDILSKNRRLKFEGVATLMQGRSKMQPVLVIALSDVLFFLLESANKYSFFTPDNKAGVVALQKLLVREKAGQDSRGIYLISSNPADPEMFELKVHKPKDKQVWIRAIRAAVQSCQEDEDDATSASGEEAKQSLIRQIVGMLRQKDLEQAHLLEEKMMLRQKLLAAAGIDNALQPPSYCHLAGEDVDSSAIWQEVIAAVQEVNVLANQLYASGTNLSRSVSSVGERQSDAYVSPTLPKRAETFGGFDTSQAGASKGAIKKHVKEAAEPGREQQLAAVQLTHYVYKLITIISQQMTSIQSLQAQCRSTGDDRRPHYRHNQQLEELRNLQDRLSREKQAWLRERDAEERDLEERRAQLKTLQEQLRAEQHDVAQQREQLFRKMEVLSQQGLLMSPTMPAPPAPALAPPDEETKPPAPKRQAAPSKPAAALPINLISANNQQKVAPNMQVRQQLPLKLAGKLGNATSSPPSAPAPAGVTQMLPLKLSQAAGGYKRLGSGSFSPPSHARTGSSPASMQSLHLTGTSAATSGNKAGRTHTYPKLPERFRVTSPEQAQPPPPPAEEEIIFF